MRPGLAAGHATGPVALAGIALVIGAALCFSILDTLAKRVSVAIPWLMALWFRYAFQALATSAVVLPLRGRAVWRTGHGRLHVLRGLLLLVSSLFAFASLKYMPVGEFTAIVMIVPLVVTLLAATVLREHVPPVRWLLVAGGFAGTLVIIRPGGEAFTWASLLPLGLVASNSWFQVLTSKLARTEDPATMQLYTGWVGALVASLALPWVWTPVTQGSLWVAMCCMGLAGTVGHFMLILAFQRAPAAMLAPYLYTQIGFATLGGWLVFAHVPDAWSLAGMALIAACGIAGAWLTLRTMRVPPAA